MASPRMRSLSRPPCLLVEPASRSASGRPMRRATSAQVLPATSVACRRVSSPSRQSGWRATSVSASSRPRSAKTWPRRVSSSAMAGARLSMRRAFTPSPRSMQHLEEPARARLGEPGPGLEDAGAARVLVVEAGVPREQDQARAADQVHLGHEADAGLLADLLVEAGVPAAAAELRIVGRQARVEAAVQRVV